MPSKGRPRLTPEELRARITEYCNRYAVTPNAEGLPPFPAGKRETRQHRDWIAVYKAHNRLARRGRGQCERCSAPTSDGSVFCEEHRAERPTHPGDAQLRHCPICGEGLGQGRAVLHARCKRLVGLAEAVGPNGLDRLRAYLWPDAATKARRR